MLLRSFHVVRRGRISFFSVDKQYSIVCMCVCVCVCVCVCIYHVFCIRLSINRDFGCFHVLAFVNNITVNKGVQLCLQDSDFYSFGCIPKCGIAGLYVVLFLTFWGTSILFFIVTIFIYIPTNSTRIPFFSVFSLTLITSCLFYDNHSDRCEVIPHCSFNLRFPDN